MLTRRVRAGSVKGEELMYRLIVKFDDGAPDYAFYYDSIDQAVSDERLFKSFELDVELAVLE